MGEIATTSAAPILRVAMGSSRMACPLYFPLLSEFMFVSVCPDFDAAYLPAFLFKQVVQRRPFRQMPA